MSLPALLTLAMIVASAPETRPPNVVVFLVDDMDLSSCSPYGARPRDVATPNMARIAADGILFTHAFVASPSCAPSRAALLTGLDPMRNGSMLNHSRPKLDVKLWPAYFRGLGYETAAIGKTAHYAQVTTYGFDHASHYTYHDDACVEAAADWLAKRESNEPLCLIVGTNWPHVPWPRRSALPPEDVALPATLVDTPATRLALTHYAAAVANADRDLGLLYDAAREHLGPGTVFIFTSDHGAQLPFGKWDVYDAGVRTPLIVAWPGKIKPGSRTDAMASWIDLLPTCLEIAGAKPPEDLSGRSLLGVLMGTTDHHRDEVYLTHSGDLPMNRYPLRAVRTRDWKYIRNLDPDAEHHTHIDKGVAGDGRVLWDSWLKKGETDPAATATTARYLRRPAEELYDLNADPAELHNLADAPEHAATKARLRARLDRWMESQADRGLETERLLPDPRAKAAKASAEPTYAGRGLRAWTAMLDDPQAARRLAAAKALGAIGPDAAPAVPELMRALDNPESLIQSQAALALGEIGPPAASSAPALLAALRRVGYYDGVFFGAALAQMGPGVVPLLIEATHERSASVRWHAVRALGRIGPDAREALGRLGELTRDPVGSVRIDAAVALWSIARRPEAISALTEALTDPDNHVRGEAARHLGEIGPEAKSAVPALIRSLDDEEDGVRNLAANALGKIGPEAKAAVPAILRLSSRSDPSGLKGPTQLKILYHSHPAAAIGPEAVPALIKGLDDPADGPRWTAAEALGRIGPEARAAVPELTRMSTSARSADRVVAAAALWRIAHDARVVPILVELARPVDGHDPFERHAALEALGEMGPAAAEAVPALIDQFAAVTETDAYKVVQVLSQIGPGARAAVEPLELISADSGDGRLRMAADLALCRITRGERGVEALIKQLQSGPYLDRSSALSVLGQIGPGAVSAVPAIVELLRDNPLNMDGPSITMEAIGALRSIGPPARAALPVLIKLFNDDALLDKSQVAGAIRAIEPDTAKTLGIR